MKYATARTGRFQSAAPALAEHADGLPAPFPTPPSSSDSRTAEASCNTCALRQRLKAQPADGSCTFGRHSSPVSQPRLRSHPGIPHGRGDTQGALARCLSEDGHADDGPSWSKQADVCDAEFGTRRIGWLLPQASCMYFRTEVIVRTRAWPKRLFCAPSV